MLYFPAIQILDEWFVRRKGLAYGIMWAGTGAAGVVFPFLFDWMLDKYGFRTTLRISAIFMVRHFRFLSIHLRLYMVRDEPFGFAHPLLSQRKKTASLAELLY